MAERDHIVNLPSYYVKDLIERYNRHWYFRCVSKFLLWSLFPMSMDDYRDHCERLFQRGYKTSGLIIIHLIGEELKKRNPRQESEIEAIRLQYLEKIYEKIVVWRVITVIKTDGRVKSSTGGIRKSTEGFR